MPAKVVDASVLGALVFQEPRAEEADAHLQGAELYAPTLLAYELTHIAQKKTRAYPALRGAFQEALESALSLDIQWLDVVHGSVLQLAQQKDITTYDASYLYLARTLGAPLVTFDVQLQAAAEDVRGQS